MSIATPALTNFTAGEISPRLAGRVDLSRYFNGCRTLENFHIHPHGGATRRSGLRFVVQALGQVRPGLLVPFESNAEEAYVLEFGEDDSGQGRMRVFSGNGPVLVQGVPLTLDMPYRADQLERLRHAQSGEVLVLAHPDHPVRTLTRKAHDHWELEEMDFIGRPAAWTDGNNPSVVAFFEQRLVLAATPAQPGTLWFSRTGEMTDFRLRTREAPLDGWRDREIVDANGDGLRDGRPGDTFTLLDGDGFEKLDGLKGQHPDGTTRYYRYKGAANLTASGADRTVTFKAAPTGSQVEPVRDAAGELDAEFWDCLEPGDRTEAPAGAEPLDDDAIEVTLSGRQANAIEFLVARGRLWVGTAGGEWTLGSSLGDPVTPASIKASQEGSCGASPTRPEAVGFATLYIQRARRKIREMAYRYESDAYVSRDLTILSEHITRPGLTQMAYVQEPDSILYCVRADGVLLALTYEPDQEVAAWSRLPTDGVVECIAAVHNPAEKRDQLWAVIRRTVGGQSRRHVEFLEAEFNGVMEDAFFVDSGATYDGEPTQTLTGLCHLAGRTVDILADGAVQTARTVDAQGVVRLDRPAARAHVGLPYVSRLQPMRLEAGSSRGTAQTKRKRITKVAVRFHDTLGGRVGPSPDRLEPVYFRSPAVPMGRASTPFCGDKAVNFPGGWTREGLLTIVQDQPLPMSVLLVVPTTVVNE
ncbi:hypothetical protein GKC30_06420 [Pseudodesulfovibrio sp. F-1]|uniref:Uncharacterized protein n=1 Tax=Pseudodesulfovibrio alkaliphilus TaxID=2661613 RepID=A0A7K1KMU7_9BACT|nr:hypothetical protein [Pseudodesulfovibrio alkaliphilus]MUM77261.1 hypothetical protein [Pseudodesulfovibrio alkaliphilus]